MTISWRKIKENINAIPNPLILAVSGGVDSVFMLDFVSRCDVDFVVAHFNHKLRLESDQEEVFVKALAEKYNKKFYVGYGKDIRESKKGIESEAREQRYAFLRSIYPPSTPCIMTAHHQDDQIENVIIRLMRGIPHHALTMTPMCQDVFRPFLDISKEEIVKQATYRGLTWMEDSSNTDENFDRNWVRHTVIPLMMQRRNIKKAIVTGIESTRRGAILSV